MSSIVRITEDFPIQRVLIVDDEQSLRTLLARALARAGFTCAEAENAQNALEVFSTGSFDLVISDIVMPGMDGVELMRQIKKKNPDTDVIIMTGYDSEYSYVDIMNAGASDYITKPFNLESVSARINRIAREKCNLIKLKKSNQQLSKAIERANGLAEEAEQASKAKTFFLASMSHEIRTPLNGIVGYTDMLMDTQLNTEQKTYLKYAKVSCDALLSVVNDILDFSKIEAGRLSLENIGFDPEVICYDTIDVIRTKVDEARVELVVAVADEVPGRVMGDPHRFRQVLLNLLGNAAKFTKEGRIKLGLSAEKIDPDNCSLIVRVEDSGIGIAENELEKIFDPFIQSEGEITNRYGGTGLGLAISRNIARKMGGDIRVESRINTGTTFYFSSLFKIVEARTSTRLRPAHLLNRKVLFCTVSDKTHPVMVKELEKSGMDVSHVDVSELFLFLKENPSTFDVGIIDFGNAGESTVETIIDTSTAIRRQAGFKFIACSIPVPGIADVFSRAGFKGFLPKPVARHKLFEMIGYVIGIKDASGKSFPDDEKILTAHFLNENKKHSASILLVEDNPVNQKMTRMMLSKAGYIIDIASNGEEAVDKYTTDPGAYDMIFMDINMPKLNGFEASEQIRTFEKSIPSNGRVPILALTANVLDDFREKCKKSGMDDFLTKPIKRDVVFQSILKWAVK